MPTGNKIFKPTEELKTALIKSLKEGKTNREIGAEYGVKEQTITAWLSNFGISANCNVGHAHNNVPIIGDNVTMSLGSQVLGGIHICNNVTIGAKALVLTDIDTEYCTVGGVPAKILTIHTPSNFVRG